MKIPGKFFPGIFFAITLKKNNNPPYNIMKIFSRNYLQNCSHLKSPKKA